MKTISKILTVLLLAVMVLSLIPNLNTPVSAASTAVLVLDSTTATAPILDHLLDLDTYGKGGPFTVTYEWKCNIKAISPTNPDAYASVQSIGTIYGSMTDQPESGIRISGNTNWTKVSYTFQNVGTYPMVGSNLPGNVFRFRLHDAKGQLYVKNLVIKNAAGTVVYNLNADPVVNQLVDQMEINGQTQADMSELAAISFDNCPWMANQFQTGNYTSYVLLESAEVTTTSSLTRPTTKPSTTTVVTTPKPTTVKPTTTAPTTAKPTTVKPTTVKPTTAKPTTIKPTTVTTQAGPCANGHTFNDGAFCIYCAEPNPDYDPCANGHEYVNGYCAYCLAPEPTAPTTVQTNAPTQAPTQAPTNAPTQAPVQQNNNNGGNDSLIILLLVAFSMILLGVIAFLAIKLSKKN